MVHARGEFVLVEAVVFICCYADNCCLFPYLGNPCVFHDTGLFLRDVSRYVLENQPNMRGYVTDLTREILPLNLNCNKK